MLSSHDDVFKYFFFLFQLRTSAVVRPEEWRETRFSAMIFEAGADRLVAAKKFLNNREMNEMIEKS
jgi:hypothetical protein